MIQPKPTIGDTSWFVRDRFGMFIHWGLYALGARHEWLQNHERIAPDDYRRYFERFDPDLYDPRAWAKAAREAGMKYVVLTTKHHEGFCLWDSQQTDYKAPNTPAGRDLLRPFVDAFRAEGLRVGFYYSLIDWHHPQFPIDHIHPLRDHPEAAQLNQSRDVSQYAAYMREQVRELITQFSPEILWFDFSYPDADPKYPQFKGKGRSDWESDKLYALVRELAPHAIVNNRLDLPDVPADVATPEQFQPVEWVQVNGEHVVWEACQTFSGSWGYHRDESSWKSPAQLVEMLIDTVSKGGNLLMNVGPTARGTFDRRALDALQSYGDWMSLHSRSVYGCTQSDFQAPSGVRLTQNFDAKRVYAHVFDYPFRHLHLPGLNGRVAYAQLLHDASELPLRTNTWETQEMRKHSHLPEDTLTLELPVRKPDVVVPVIELFLKDAS